MVIGLEVIVADAVDGQVTEIPLPDGVQRGDFVVCAITAVPPDSSLRDPRFEVLALGATGVTGGLLYRGFLVDDFTPIPVEQSEFAGLDAGHTLVIYRGIRSVGPALTYTDHTIRDGGTDNPFPITGPPDHWHGALALAVIHTLDIPGPVRMDAPWYSEANVFTPFFGAGSFRYDSDALPLPSFVAFPRMWADGHVTDVQMTMVFGFMIEGLLQATRQFPRDDAAGVIGGTRVFPPPRSDRLGGGRHL